MVGPGPQKKTEKCGWSPKSIEPIWTKTKKKKFSMDRKIRLRMNRNRQRTQSSCLKIDQAVDSHLAGYHRQAGVTPGIHYIVSCQPRFEAVL